MIYDTLIIGGGVVGLSILRSALLAGHSAILIERNADLCDGASGRNSGVLCTGVDAPSGSLERALIRDSISRTREFCEAHNVPKRECGSLVCRWPWDDDEAEEDEDEDEDEKKSSSDGNDVAVRKNDAGDVGLRRVLRESHVAGDGDASLLTPEEVAAMEPSLSSECRGAVHVPGETVVDPWLFCLALAVHSREIAARNDDPGGTTEDVICTGREVVMDLSSFDAAEGVWSVATRATTADDDDAEAGDGATTIAARCVVNAAGIDADLVQSAASVATKRNASKLLPPNFEARPRRGQYMVFNAPPEWGALADRHDAHPSEWPTVPRTVPARPIQPVPSQFTKGIFVYSTLYDQVVAGPTALDQSSRTDDVPDDDAARDLARHASRVLGRELGKADAAGEYVGIRPGTSRRDYQIRLHPTANFVAVAGVRSTGLTASLGIGRHVVQCLLPAVVLPRGGRGLKDDSSSVMARPPPTPLPDVGELVRQYHERGDGKIVVGGHEYRVTHPLTKMGWAARTGLAALPSSK